MVKKNLNNLLASIYWLKKNRPLCIPLPKMSAYGRYFDESKYMSFLIKYELL